ncbi:MAG: hypothetical protein Q3979_07735 [Actinomycetaceae bacterium]|nr:hypothetical protein [Actinomycetaceae bacterium]
MKAWRNRPDGMRSGQLNLLKRNVGARLRRTQEDPELDSRSMESVAWMANELHLRIEAAFPEADIKVYRGSVTAGARRAAGIDSRVNLLGEKGKKDRLDRRHHAVDAAIVALMEPGIAKTIAERSNLRQAQFLSGEEQTWRNYKGATPGARESFERWSERMLRLSELLNEAIASDKIHVTENVRLRLGDGSAHDDTVRPLAKVRLGDGLSVSQTDRASSPALWCAITREPDFDPSTGLPQSENREIRVHGRRVSADDSVALFAKKAKDPDEKPFAAIAVRDGFAEIGSTIHHARIYRIEDKKPKYAMLRVFTCDLLRHRHEDLFSAPIPPQSISMRCAEPKLRQAIAEGRATYLGWLVTGDELEIPMESFTDGQIGQFRREFPSIACWRLHGFFSESKLRLRPAYLSAEGLSDTMTPEVKKTLTIPGWVTAVNRIAAVHPRVVRRDVLGRPRLSNRFGLPRSWTVE